MTERESREREIERERDPESEEEREREIRERYRGNLSNTHTGDNREKPVEKLKSRPGQTHY